MNYFEMKVSGVVVDPTSYSPMIILKDSNEKNVLPLWVGITEATAIMTELEKVEVERPMTHDLAKSIVISLGAELVKVSVVDLKDNIFYATLSLRTAAGHVIEIDSRPSDAIALAMRCEVPILVSEDVITQSKVIDLTSDEIKGMDNKELTSLLENISAEDFGKYKM